MFYLDLTILIVVSKKIVSLRLEVLISENEERGNIFQI